MVLVSIHVTFFHLNLNNLLLRIFKYENNEQVFLYIVSLYMAVHEQAENFPTIFFDEPFL